MNYKHLFFRIVYRAVYVLLYLILIALLVITPADAIERSLQNKQTYNVFILALTYAATFLILGFLYAIRLYVNKTALAAIPKQWVPIDKGDVKERVHNMISAALNRSAAITFLSRPRNRTAADENELQENMFAQPRVPVKTARTVGLELGVLLPAKGTKWTNIEQRGWSSPNSHDLPNLHYGAVLSELPNLIEAKALTLAPRDATSTADPPVVDADAAEVLQRDTTMTIRAYLENLADLGVVNMDATVNDFLTKYEYARFSTRPISNAEFRDLMHLFAEVLRTMTPLDLEILAQDGADGHRGAPSESDIDSDAPMGTNPTTPRSHSPSSSSHNSVPSRVPLTRRTSSFNAWSQYATAPNTPGSRRTATPGLSMTRKASNNSLGAQGTPSRRPQMHALTQQRSNASLRSSGSDSSRSIIRLATREDRSDVPYVLNLRPTMEG